MNGTSYPELTNVRQQWSRDAIQAAAYGARRDDRLNVRSYLSVDATTPARARSDEPRPGPLSRLACHFGIHRWVTMTTGRAGFVHFQRCDRRCGSDRVVKGLGA
jgi:hypothetical protein